MFNPPDTVADTTESLVQLEMTVAGTLSELRVRLSASAGAAGSFYTFTVRKNGNSTAVTCIVLAGTSNCFDIVNSAGFAAGDLISIQSTPSTLVAPTDNLEVRWTAKYAPA